MREFPQGEDRWQASERGGCQPRWSRDGKELFYVEGGVLVALKVLLREASRLARPSGLFEDLSLSGTTWDYDVSADGRFVMVENVVAEGQTRHKPAIRSTEN